MHLGISFGRLGSCSLRSLLHLLKLGPQLFGLSRMLSRLCRRVRAGVCARVVLVA